MHIVVEQTPFQEAVSQVIKAVSSRTTLPILTGIKIEVTETACILTGSDADMSIQVSIPTKHEDKEWIKVVKLGSIVLPAKYFADIVRKAPRGELELEVLDNQVTKIKAGTALFQLNGLSADEYPPLPYLDKEQMFRISAQQLKTLIRHTVFAAATNESRPQLTGVLFKLDQQKLTLTATDSHRLARRSAQVTCEEAVSFDQVIVPGRSLQELQRLLEDASDDVEVVVSSHQLLVKAGRRSFYSRLLDGTFPDTERIIPSSFKAMLVVDRQNFLAVLERASLLARDGKHVVKLRQEQDRLEIKSTSPEVGQVVEQINPEGYEGEEVQIAFNAKYMIEALRASEGETVEIRFTGALSPFMIRAVDTDELLHLIVPVRT